MTTFEPSKSKRAFLRAFLAKKFGGLLKILYLCIVNEKRRNLRPNWATKIAKRAGTCNLGKSQNGVQSEISKILGQAKRQSRVINKHLLTI